MALTPDSYLAKKVGHLLHPAEVPVISLGLGGGTGRQTADTPDDVVAVLTDQRIVFVHWGLTKPKGVWRAVDIGELADVGIDRLATGVNRPAEFVLRFRLASGEHITGITLAAGGGKREIDQFLAAFDGLPPPAPPAPPPPPPPG